MPNPAPDLAPLLGEVQSLTAASRDNAQALRGVTTRLRRHRLALIVGGVGLVLDLVLSVMVVLLFAAQRDIDDRQECVNDRTARFLAAEHSKVAGQVAGLELLRDADGDRAQAFRGLEEFISASKTYLHSIESIGDRCPNPS